MRRTIAGLFLAFSLTAASAQAVTLKDIVELSQAGLGDEVLLALIEVDGGVFNVDPVTLTRLKAAGVSETVIVALVRSGRTRPVPEPAPAVDVAPPPAPEVVYVQQPPTVVVREVAVPVAVPVYVGYPVSVHGGHNRPHTQAAETLHPSITAPQSIQAPQHYLTDTPPPPKNQEPVYWGSGGKLRPDAWKPKP